MSIAFYSGREGVLLMTIIIFAIILYQLVVEGERKKSVKRIRLLPPVEAIPEAVGRSVEMGRPMHFNPGNARLNTTYGPATLAALSVLQYIARLAVRDGARLIVTCQQADAYPLEYEIMREAYVSAGQPEMFREDDVRYYSQIKAVAGMMQREHVAANFIMGKFDHESLVLAEAGSQAGAVNIGGVAKISQVPFMLACCDYCLLGEEMFAASAYITKDSVQTNIIAGQDYIKFVLIGLSILGTLLSTAGIMTLTRIFGG